MGRNRKGRGPRRGKDQRQQRRVQGSEKGKDRRRAEIADRPAPGKAATRQSRRSKSGAMERQRVSVRSPVVGAPELADFDFGEIAEAVSAAKEKNNAYIRIELEKRAKTLDDRGERKRAHALALLAYICG